MKSSISICGGMYLDEMLTEIIEIVSPEAVDSIYTEEKTNGNKIIHLINLEAKDALSKTELADFLSQWIVKNYEQKIMLDILKQNFVNITSNDALIIVKDVIRQINDDVRFKHSRLVSHRLLEYFSQNEILNIEGFIRFRLKEYRSQLEEFLFEAIDDYMAEKEYEAFIDMLCEYVNIQSPVIELIHIKEKEDGSFSFYDFSQHNISVVCENELKLEMPDAYLSNEDRLISILLILVPKRIIWHNGKNNSNIFNTVKKIFKDRLTLCNGCHLCEE